MHHGIYLFIIFLFKNNADLSMESPMNGRVAVLTEMELNSPGEKNLPDCTVGRQMTGRGDGLA